MDSAKQTRDYATVEAWIHGLAEQWGEAPSDLDGRLDTLRRFCEFVEREPDEIIQECSREVEGGKRIRVKKRRFYSEKIDAFQATLDGEARERVRAGNVVRSFLIHNGIFIQGGVASA